MKSNSFLEKRGFNTHLFCNWLTNASILLKRELKTFKSYQNELSFCSLRFEVKNGRMYMLHLLDAVLIYIILFNPN